MNKKVTLKNIKIAGNGLSGNGFSGNGISGNGSDLNKFSIDLEKALNDFRGGK